jgi:hypothetical protein
MKVWFGSNNAAGVYVCPLGGSLGLYSTAGEVVSCGVQLPS